MTKQVTTKVQVLRPYDPKSGRWAWSPASSGPNRERGPWDPAGADPDPFREEDPEDNQSLDDETALPGSPLNPAEVYDGHCCCLCGALWEVGSVKCSSCGVLSG